MEVSCATMERLLASATSAQRSELQDAVALPPTERIAAADPVTSGRATVAVGDILLAHPLSLLFQPQLDQAVILVSDVAPEGFVKGIALNKLDEAATLGAYL